MPPIDQTENPQAITKEALLARMYTRLKKRVKIEVSEQPDPIKIKLSKTQEQKPLNNQSLTSVDKEVLELLEADNLNKSSAVD